MELDHHSGADGFPTIFDHLLDQVVLDRAFGLAMVEEGLIFAVEIFLIFLGKDDGAGAKAVCEVIEAGYRLALVGFGPGGVLGVETVGLDLSYSCHENWVRT